MDITHVSETVLSPPGAAAPIRDDAVLGQDSTSAGQVSSAAGPSNANVGQNGQDGEPGQPPLSKSQMKKQAKRQRRLELYEERKQDRRRLRKEKRHEQTARNLEKRAAVIAEAEAAGLDPQAALEALKPAKIIRTTVPVTFLVDCDFEEYMSDKELVSLSSQIIRCYSDNRAGRFQAHLVMSGWKGKLKERFDTVIQNHVGWKGTHFMEGDFVEAAGKMFEYMKGPKGGELTDIVRPSEEERQPDEGAAPVTSTDPTPVPEPQTGDQSVVYLTSDSPYTLDRLEPYTSYVIGGIVDRNREKGLCYRRACERGVRTAKLPIGDYMVMASRKVLTTNQVVQIMVKWLETGDWQTAFQGAIPKRKGGVMKGADGDDANEEEDGGEDGENEQEQSHGGDESVLPDAPTADATDVSTKPPESTSNSVPNGHQP